MMAAVSKQNLMGKLDQPKTDLIVSTGLTYLLPGVNPKIAQSLRASDPEDIILQFQHTIQLTSQKINSFRTQTLNCSQVTPTLSSEAMFILKKWPHFQF